MSPLAYDMTSGSAFAFLCLYERSDIGVIFTASVPRKDSALLISLLLQTHCPKPRR